MVELRERRAARLVGHSPQESLAADQPPPASQMPWRQSSPNPPPGAPSSANSLAVPGSHARTLEGPAQAPPVDPRTVRQMTSAQLPESTGGGGRRERTTKESLKKRREDGVLAGAGADGTGWM